MPTRNNLEPTRDGETAPLHLAELLTRSKRDVEEEFGLRVYGYHWRVERIDDRGRTAETAGVSLTTDDPRTVARRVEGEIEGLDPLVRLSEAIVAAGRTWNLRDRASVGGDGNARGG
jgi:hypothetical protein